MTETVHERLFCRASSRMAVWRMDNLCRRALSWWWRQPAALYVCRYYVVTKALGIFPSLSQSRCRGQPGSGRPAGFQKLPVDSAVRGEENCPPTKNFGGEVWRRSAAPSVSGKSALLCRRRSTFVGRRAPLSAERTRGERPRCRRGVEVRTGCCHVEFAFPFA